MTDPARDVETAAGRILLREHSSGTPHMARHIAAIEAEARDLERREVRAAVEGLPGYIEQRGTGDLVEYVVLRAAVLAILADREQEGG